MIEYFKTTTHTMNAITEYKQLTYVYLKDWRILTTEKSPKEIYDWIKDNSHIMIDWELHSKFSIDHANVVSLDSVEGLILAQSKEIQQKMRQKRAWLMRNMDRDMTLEYAKNYLSKLIAN